MIKCPDNWISGTEMKSIQCRRKLCPACSCSFLRLGSLVLSDNTVLALALICKQLRMRTGSVLIQRPGKPQPRYVSARVSGLSKWSNLCQGPQEMHSNNFITKSKAFFQFLFYWFISISQAKTRHAHDSRKFTLVILWESLF